MDPSNVLGDVSSEPITSVTPPPNLSSEPINLQVNVRFSTDQPEVKFIDTERLTRYNRIRVGLGDNRAFDRLRDKVNPYDELGTRGLGNRAGMKLANLDADFKLSGIYNLVIGSDAEEFFFADIAGGPGSFSRYLQIRRPNSVGFGITLPGKLDWDYSIVRKYNDSLRVRPDFRAFYGDDGSGDLNKYAKEFSVWVKGQVPGGVHLVVCDGGLELPVGANKEIVFTRLFVSEIFCGLMSLAEGGNFLIKIFETATEAMAGVVYVLSMCFEQLYIVKPITSRPTNSERYIIGLQRRGGIDPYVRIFNEIYTKFDADRFLTHITSVPGSFTQKLTDINNYVLNQQLSSIANVVRLKAGQDITLPQKRIDRVLAAWALPDNKIIYET